MVLWLIITAFCAGIWLWIRRKRPELQGAEQPPELPEEPTAEERICAAIRTLEEPREIYNGRWFKHTVKMVECDPPAHVMRARQPPPTIVDPRQPRAQR